jgi:FkbM family methyltransferase
VDFFTKNLIKKYKTGKKMSKNEKIFIAIENIKRDKEVKKFFLEAVRNFEKKLTGYTGAVREEITGPLIDSVHDDDDEYHVTLACGLKIHFLYRSKIARDLLMSASEAPSHVWEPQTTKLLLKLADFLEGDVIVGGAYFGDQALLVSKKIQNKNLSVHCFEPNTDQAAMLEKNIYENKIDNIVVNKKGLWKKSSYMMSLDGYDSFASSKITLNSENGFSTISIDDYVFEKKIKIGLIQLDIEGGELAALEGAEITINRDAPHIVFEIHRNYVDWSLGILNTPICKFLTEKGYVIFAIRDINSHMEIKENGVEIIPLDNIYLDGPSHGFNMLAVKNAEILKSDFFTVVESVSPKLLPHKNKEIHHPINGF